MATASDDPVLIDKPRPHTSVITLNRPERMNSMAFELMVPLHDAFEEVVIVEETGLPDASPAVDVARTLTIIAAVVSAALIFLIFALTKPRMLGLIPVGVAVSLSASITAFLVPGGRSLTFSIADDARVDVVVTNLYDALVHALQRQSRFLLLIGVAMAVVGILQWLQMRKEADRAATRSEA